MINNKKHIIFDWNGTLVNDAWIFVDILNALLIPRGLHPITLKEYQNSFCFPIKSFYEKLGVDVSEKAFQKIEKDFVREYNQRMYQPQLFDDTINTIIQLIQSDISLSILSASNQEVLTQLVEYYSLTQYFDYIIGVDNYGANGKIECGRALIKQLNQPRNQIILIGDTDYDYEVASQLNINCILKTNGHQSINKLKIKTNNIIKSLKDLIDK